MKFCSTILILIVTVALYVAAAPPAAITRKTPSPSGAPSLTGRWQVKFTLSGVGEKKLILESRGEGSASIRLLDTEPDNKPVDHPLPAASSVTPNGQINLSSEVELPIGTCCREVGTLVLKGRAAGTNSFSGTAIFIGSTHDDENPLGFRSMLGTFTATRVASDK